MVQDPRSLLVVTNPLRTRVSKIAPHGCASTNTGGKDYGQKDVLVSNAGDFPGNRRVLGTQSPGSRVTKSKSKSKQFPGAGDSGPNEPGGSVGHVYRYFR